jgi:putative oxidoreductase
MALLKCYISIMKNKVLFVLSLLLGLMMINSGLNKFFEYIPMSEQGSQDLMDLLTAMKTIAWLIPLVAVVEIIGGLLLIIPKTRALGAIVLFPVIVGILVSHIVDDPAGIAIAIILMAINLWVIYENRAKYLPMIG